MNQIQKIQESLGELWLPLFVLVCIIAFIAVIAQWALYNKANQPGWACLVPVYNVIVFLRIIGRPPSHIFLALIPIYNIYFFIKIYVELCQSFGKTTMTDYVLCIVFNGFYVFHLGLSESTEYKGPVYNQGNQSDKDAPAQAKPA